MNESKPHFSQLPFVHFIFHDRGLRIAAVSFGWHIPRRHKSMVEEDITRSLAFCFMKNLFKAAADLLRFSCSGHVFLFISLREGDTRFLGTNRLKVVNLDGKSLYLRQNNWKISSIENWRIYFSARFPHGYFACES